MLSTLILLIAYAPPIIRVEKAQTTIIQNGNTIVISADGSIKITGPTIDLSLPGNGAEDPFPIFPPDLAPVSPYQKLFDSDVSTLIQKKLVVNSLVKIWDQALKDLPAAKTTGEFHDNLKTMSKPLGITLIDMRKFISQDLSKIVVDDIPMTQEISDKIKSNIQSILVHLKEIK